MTDYDPTEADETDPEQAHYLRLRARLYAPPRVGISYNGRIWKL